MRELEGDYPVLEIKAELVLIHAAAHVQLSSMFELQAVALLLGRPIVRSDKSGGIAYFVLDGATVYMYHQTF